MSQERLQMRRETPASLREGGRRERKREGERKGKREGGREGRREDSENESVQVTVYTRHNKTTFSLGLSQAHNSEDVSSESQQQMIKPVPCNMNQYTTYIKHTTLCIFKN